ncbi:MULTISPECIES: DUF6893 family small protein [Nonomuraea]|uniref:Uncharacterized protein n=1 Tax=Nonomuraea roseoviolacea subsp. carminata TaxID=160689 RepID=A0ABT1KDY9_9ACTN|nr:hypothetical protein [Nonomuraea roseoviolacea subsp. carminata]
MRKRHVAALIAIATVSAVIVRQWPEIHRYITMKRM